MEKLKRQKILSGRTTCVETGCGKLYVTVNKSDDKPFEVFATLGKAGGCAVCQNEGLTRLATLCLRYGIPIEEVIRQLKDLQCPSRGLEVKSCSDAISMVLESQAKEIEKQNS